MQLLVNNSSFQHTAAVASAPSHRSQSVVKQENVNVPNPAIVKAIFPSNTINEASLRPLVYSPKNLADKLKLATSLNSSPDASTIISAPKPLENRSILKSSDAGKNVNEQSLLTRDEAAVKVTEKDASSVDDKPAKKILDKLEKVEQNEKQVSQKTIDLSEEQKAEGETVEAQSVARDKVSIAASPIPEAPIAIKETIQTVQPAATAPEEISPADRAITSLESRTMLQAQSDIASQKETKIKEEPIIKEQEQQRKEKILAVRASQKEALQVYAELIAYFCQP